MGDFAEGYMIGQGNSNTNDGWGCGGGWWILLLLLCCWGGNNGWNNGGGNQMIGYELGKVATQADIASGFNNSAVLSSLNDIKLGQQQAINYNNQGFSGLHQSISDCCCQTQRSIDGVNYNMARNTCDIIQAGKDNTQRIIDYFTCRENQELRDQNFALRLQASQSAQNAYLVDQLRPTARPAYITCSPFDSAFGRSSGCFGGYGSNNCIYNNG